MAGSVQTLIAVLFVLQIKHYICDYPLQTAFQLNNKGTYLHPGGIVHAGLHALFTTTAFILAPPTLLLGIGIVGGEFLVHYHIDWVKEQIVRQNGWTTSQNAFWWAIGVDQLLHYMTYLVIGALLVGAWHF